MDKPDAAAFIACEGYVKELVRAAWTDGYKTGVQDSYDECVEPIDEAWDNIIGVCDIDITDKYKWEFLTNNA